MSPAKRIDDVEPIETGMTQLQIKSTFIAGDIEAKQLIGMLKFKKLTSEDIRIILPKLKERREATKPKENTSEEGAPGPSNLNVIEITDPMLLSDVDRLLQDPALLHRINKILGIEVIGEEENRILMFVLCISHRTKFKQIISVKGDSSVGKNYLCDHTFGDYMNNRNRGRLSATAHEHGDFSPWEILYIQQQFSKKTGNTLKLVSTSDGGFEIEITTKIKDGDGEDFTTITKKIDPMTVVTTTIYVKLDPEWETRSWSIIIDDSKAQTERITKHIDLRESQYIQMLAGDVEAKKIFDDKIILKAFVNCLPQVDEILIPFDLAEYFPHDKIRVRRDFNKFRDLVRLSAYLHMVQRPAGWLRDKKVVFASPKDVWYALRMAGKTLSGTITGIGKRMRDVAEHIEEDSVFTISELQIKMADAGSSKSKNTIYYAIRELVREGLLSKTGNKIGNADLYLTTKQFKSLLDWEIKRIDYVKMKKDFKNTLDHIISSGNVRYEEKNWDVYDPVTGEKHEI